MAIITAGQCRAARALLAWSQRDLEVKSGVSRLAIANFEREASTPYARTLKDIVAVFENAGIIFQEAQEGVIGPGVALKWEIDTSAGVDSENDKIDERKDGLYSAQIDDDYTLFDETCLKQEDREWLEYIRNNPELSNNGRHILMLDAIERFYIKQQEGNDSFASMD